MPPLPALNLRRKVPRPPRCLLAEVEVEVEVVPVGMVPPSRSTLSQRAVSLWRNVANSAGVLPTASAPIANRRS